MTLLHVYYALRNKQAFQRMLDGSNDRGHPSALGSGALSHSGGKSWNSGSTLTMAISYDINARDRLGRTVLHLACSSIEPSGIDFVKLLLNHHAVDVNLQDTESQWTALHRALYQGNIASAILLLQRSDTDTSLKDIEGYTAFDLYNSTIEVTKPSFLENERTELFTWGTNKNAALGHGDGDDRIFPYQVVIPTKDISARFEKPHLDSRFLPVHVKHVSMSKLHTAVVTTESHGNLRICGFGSGGRLGPGQHTQYKLKSLPQFAYAIISVALGQDHTLALTKSGEVLSWGLNRFHQLGYMVESSTNFGLDEPIQSTPRKVVGVLRKEVVQGVAACKMASACWTTKEVFTWGTNNGQLGYDKLAQPVQVSPRVVSKISQPVTAITITDFALACLLNSQDVLCIWNDRHFKINFPTHTFPSEIRSLYRPPQALKDAHIDKITSCDDTFAALSSNGEVFVFTLPQPTDADHGPSSGKERTVKPQRVWALRKQFSAAKDVALGSDGSIIICTESGHVFVRSRTTKAGQSHGNSTKPFKFQRIHYLQRVTSVYANNTGAYGALRVEWRPRDITVHGNVLGEDLGELQPYLHFGEGGIRSRLNIPPPADIPKEPIATQSGQDDEMDDLSIQKDIQSALHLIDILRRDKQSRRGPGARGLFDIASLPDGADVVVQTQSGSGFPAHRIILAARCSALCEVLSGTRMIPCKGSEISVHLLTHTQCLQSPAARLGISGCHEMSVIILLTYLYSDDLLPIWDRRVTSALGHHLDDLKVNFHYIKQELQTLARILDLPFLAQALESSTKLVPVSTLARDMSSLFHQTQSEQHPPNSPLAADVVLQLADRDVFCHSTLLRARSLFFADFFNEEAWTANRWDVDGKIRVNVKHLTWRVMQFVLRFICCGEEIEMFETLDFIHSADEVLEFMFEIMSAANELLLDRLVLHCSVVIQRYSNIHNACYILADATHFHCLPLVESLQSYMAINMEALLESRMVDDLTPDLVNQLAEFVRRLQAQRSPISRSNTLVNKAMESQADWLSLQDIPQPIVPSNRHGRHKPSPKLSPPSPSRISHRPSGLLSPIDGPVSTRLGASRTSQASDEIFIMDDSDIFRTPTLEPNRRPTTEGHAVLAWKGTPSVPRVDMKAIMAEAASSKVSDTRNSGSVLRSRGSEVWSSVTQQIPAYEVPQCEERKIHGQSAGDTVVLSNAVSSARSSGSPWRIPAPQIPTKPVDLSSRLLPPLAIPSISLRSPKGAILDRHRAKADEQPAPFATKPLSTPSRQHFTQPGLGPVFTPSRQDSTSSAGPSSRRLFGKAWTLPPVQPVVNSSPPDSIVSFVAIQQLQHDQGAFTNTDKRSLLEIQEEEQARQVEADFLKWWSAEEEKVKLESLRSSQPPRSSSGKAAQTHRKSRGKTNISQATSLDPLNTSPAIGSQPQHRSRRWRPGKQPGAAHGGDEDAILSKP